jgi:hypothetical protein
MVKMLNRDILASFFFFLVSLFILLNFIMIVFKGQTTIGFENMWLNVGELILAAACVSFALERFFYHGKRIKG